MLLKQIHLSVKAPHQTADFHQNLMKELIIENAVKTSLRTILAPSSSPTAQITSQISKILFFIVIRWFVEFQQNRYSRFRFPKILKFVRDLALFQWADLVQKPHRSSLHSTNHPFKLKVIESNLRPKPSQEGWVGLKLDEAPFVLISRHPATFHKNPMEDLIQKLVLRTVLAPNSLTEKLIDSKLSGTSFFIVNQLVEFSWN